MTPSGKTPRSASESIPHREASQGTPRQADPQSTSQVVDTPGSDGKAIGALGASPCCHFAGHPLFCCRAEAGKACSGAARHLVQLERRAGADRLGFGNLAAGPPGAPVLVVSWIREGALQAWNETAPEGLAVPPQSAIVSVNGVTGDIQRMREELRAQVVKLEVIAPDRWKYSKVTNY